MNDRRKSSSGDGEQSFHLDEDSCLDLLYDLVPPEEKERLLSHLASCALCEKRFYEEARVREDLLTARVLRSLPGGEIALERPSDALAASEAQETPFWRALTSLWASFLSSFRRPHLQWAGGLAAAAVVLLLVLWPHPAGPPDSTLLRPLPMAFDNARVRAIGDTSSEDLAAGLEAYRDEDLQRAIDLLGRAQVTGQLETVRRVYLGSALAMAGRHREAVEVLEVVSFGALPEEWGDEAHWTLYVALGASGREASADSLLRILAKSEGEVGDRARGLFHEAE